MVNKLGSSENMEDRNARDLLSAGGGPEEINFSLSLSLSLPCCDAEIEGQEPSDLNCVIDCDGG